jgi:prolyl-tRNA editing enzyme YbaK/EbsC (Cys-tRNA(Pro) deacylase)
MEYHKAVKKIKDLLTQGGYWFESFEHEPVRTSEQAAKIRTGYTLREGAKSIIVRVKERGGGKYFAMLVIPGDAKFDVEKVEGLFNAKDIRFANEDEVKEMTGGVLPGGVPPFGNLFDLKVVADPHLFENEKIIFNAGDRGFSIAMYSKDYRRLVEPLVESIV